LSVPVAFQYPEAAALFGLAPLGYFLSRGLKKYHSRSPKIAFPVAIFHIMDRLHNLHRQKPSPHKQIKQNWRSIQTNKRRKNQRSKPTRNPF
jgi:hypothetical protein